MGLPATSVNFGPFGGVGMAAAAADSMRALGLHALHPSEARAAFDAGGCAPQHVRVQLDLAKFTKINQARGRWRFLDQLLTVPADEQGWRGSLAAEVRLHLAVGLELCCGGSVTRFV